MNAKLNTHAIKSGIQRARTDVRHSWSREERDKRRRIANARQQKLHSMLFSQQTVIPLQVA